MKQRLSLKARALQLLAQREHSRLELRRKLLAHAERLAREQAADEARAGPGSDAPGEPAATRSRRAPPSPQIEAEVDALLDELAASGIASEARFVETRVRARAARHGNLRIVQELARHGLQLSADEARDLKASEYARAKAVWLRRFGAPPSDAAGRARQMRFLAARGFSADIVRRLLRGADDDS
ncbi:MAG TPA: regulatory protein RecX [Burkholderiaceae bacterium]|nr:regulatory protein RecX [Burkholderiaceae bacterium]